MNPEARITGLEVWREALTGELGRDREAQGKTNTDVELRLRAVEKTIWKAAGASAGAIGLLEIILKVIH